MEKEIKTIEIGSHNVVILDKMFGPTIFATLRITPDIERGWVIERQRIDAVVIVTGKPHCVSQFLLF